MNKIFKSRTFWAAVIAFLVAVVPQAEELLGGAFEPVMGLLTLLVGYFKVNPSQEY